MFVILTAILDHLELIKTKGTCLIQMYIFFNMLSKYCILSFVSFFLGGHVQPEIHLKCLWRTEQVNAANIFLHNAWINLILCIFVSEFNPIKLSN